ncbi:MAG TPA: glutathione S-transferase N-terminal domain-containing protein [Rhodocyclaceae bacterium]|nr:glutathione S-transferase N-terminal domain-containing protein [Rhodocyclaceae bacterium]
MPDAFRHQAAVLGSVLASTLTAWRGTRVVKAAAPPSRLLQLYDMEGCPYCRIVREALTALALDAQIYPCPKGGKRYRKKAEALSGRMQFPLLVDPNTETAMLESTAIVDYLFRTYGGGPPPRSYRPGALTGKLAAMATAVRVMRGLRYRPARRPRRSLALWSFESSPYSRLVRERLTELELPYVLHNLGKEQWADMGPAAMRLRPGPYRPKPGGRREEVLGRLGRVQVPYLEDPNTGVRMFESADIVDYLEKQYAL